jgi:uncharacterized damage-inducible protein DinB
MSYWNSAFIATRYDCNKLFEGKFMSIIETLIRSFKFNRVRTLALLDKIEQEPNPEQVLGWRPGPGRAHIAWQLLHIGVTEEIFATERLLPSKPAQFTDLIPRFRGGSTPDDNIPAAGLIRQVLTEARAHLLDTLSQFSDDQLSIVPEALQARNLSMLDVLHIISWHEAHHQGQSHITLNLYKGK